MSHVRIQPGFINGRKANAYASYLSSVADPSQFSFAETSDIRSRLGGQSQKILAIRNTDGAKVMLKCCDYDRSGFAEVATYRIAHRLRFQANEVQYLTPADCSAIGLHGWRFGGTIHTWNDSFLNALTLRENSSAIDHKTKDSFDKMQLALVWLDTLVNNQDRHKENYGAIAYDGDLTLFAIDHGHCATNDYFRCRDIEEMLERTEFFFNSFTETDPDDFLTAIQFRHTRFAQARRVLDILSNFWTKDDWDSIFCDMPKSFKPFLSPLMDRHVCLVERYKKYLRIK
jgi:hypothetical protein